MASSSSDPAPDTVPDTVPSPLPAATPSPAGAPFSLRLTRCTERMRGGSLPGAGGCAPEQHSGRRWEFQSSVGGGGRVICPRASPWTSKPVHTVKLEIGCGALCGACWAESQRRVLLNLCRTCPCGSGRAQTTPHLPPCKLLPVPSTHHTNKLMAWQNDMYEEGVAAYKAKDYTKAAELLSEVVENLAAQHGDLAPECADAYFQVPISYQSS